MSAVKQFFAARPYIFSIIIVTAVVLWMLSGQLSSAEKVPLDSTKTEHQLTRVQVKTFTAEPIERSLHLYGQTEARRQSVISAEVSGRLLEFLVAEGRPIKKGQALARLDIQDRRSQLLRAEALLEQRTIEYAGVKALSKQGFQGKARLAEAKASLVEAESMVKTLNLAIDNTLVLSPYTGIFEENIVEAGAYLGIGDPILRLADTQQLLVRTDVSERDISQLKLDKKAYVTLVTGQEVEGTIDFIATLSDANTRTFKVEVLLKNQDQKLMAGVSASVRIPLEEVAAIKVSPAVLALDEQGNLGVKTVVDDVVQFIPADLVRSDPDGAWLSGFTGDNDVIVLGQGFVREGDKVEPVTKAELLAQERLE
ncbi:efflux RND transporter periplasmic adaptor subunit [Agarivorans sp. 1_MG-2023]|uniref:efflux RND transporter periplasmic adaptor subunit n=1 Tax=Agarivorans sp. 1_MG-2023 TaxID=3062634 RepID=UPI0026E3EBC0|nr:efflux RND transporter periplasmic adaptor subunit [Agarivorans sp. 1_MG-2023]MDO6763624.1 efflux RND transporter periplasmic adaptor subunit [Agarivorans sp. 1_MG-2023]